MREDRCSPLQTKHAAQFIQHGTFLLTHLLAAKAQKATLLGGPGSALGHGPKQAAVGGGILWAGLAVHQPDGLPHALQALRAGFFQVAGPFLPCQHLGVGRRTQQIGGHRLQQRRSTLSAHLLANRLRDGLRLRHQASQATGAGRHHRRACPAGTVHHREPLLRRKIVLDAHAITLNGRENPGLVGAFTGSESTSSSISLSLPFPPLSRLTSTLRA
ncbi:hypothetical protein Dgeo_0511 [Deinococcus geothermalis DSM 11300]|uniref:Uncharacterized protein n=1 Tax=Deinococcus geothermalis (strain DSM 11300 / CIP 105573 / AG-3a) TaxID=319795 RepID=Q1J121_DEIGD|nr:hypothetical protein Dgeo_0511 [Deinococcus geothermalis DSM 11300]